MMSTDSSFDSALEVIYSAALGNNNEWDRVLEIICKKINAVKCEFYINQRLLSAYPSDKSQINNASVDTKFFSISIALTNIENEPATITFYNQNTSFSDEVLSFLQEIKSHLNRALLIRNRLKIEQQDTENLYTLYDRFLDGILLINSRGQIQYSNPSAKRIINQSAYLSINNSQELVTIKPEHTTSIRDSLKKAITHQSNDDRISVSPHQHLIIDENNFPIKFSFIAINATKSVNHLYKHGIVAAIFLQNLKPNHHIALDMLKQVYKLSSSELLLCAKFVNHPSIETCAEELNLSENSVRTYIKKIYEKTGQNSQAGLMRLLMSYIINID